MKEVTHEEWTLFEWMTVKLLLPNYEAWGILEDRRKRRDEKDGR